jgi:hypothetical protein
MVNNTYKPVKLETESGEVDANSFAFIHVKKRMYKKLKVIECNGTKYNLYQKFDNTCELRIPRSVFTDRIVKIDSDVKFRTLKDVTDPLACKKIKEAYGPDFDENNIMLGFSCICIDKNLEGTIELINEFDEIEIGCYFDNWSKYKIDFDTLCEVLRNP